MEHILGDELPSPFTQRSFEADCNGGELGSQASELEERAYDFVVARSWSEVMIPVYDMVNHKVSLLC